MRIEDLENDLETVINKYNNLISLYNNLINIKNYEENKKINNGIYNKSNTITNVKTKLTDRTITSKINLNNSNEKEDSKLHIYRKNNKNNNKIKSILIQGSNKIINNFDNDYINHLKKENERLKKIIITYENINSNLCPKKSANTLKGRNYLINNKIKRISERAKRSISKVNSKEHSYIMNAYKSKNMPNKNYINNKSSLLFIMKQNKSINHKNNLMDYSLITDSSLILPKKKKILEIPKNNTVYNTINNNNIDYKNILKKNNTNINSGKDNKNNTANKRMINKLKVKCKDSFLDRNKNNFSREKITNKYTPRNIIENNDSFFAQTNNNYGKIKNNNKLRSFKLLNLDNNFINININDMKNNTASNYFFNKTKYDEKKENKNILKTEINNNNANNANNANLIIHRNSEHKIGNKFRLIKEFKTEKNFMNNNEIKDDIYYSNENDLSNNEFQKIKINRKNIFFKKSQNSLRDAINKNNQNNQNIINKEKEINSNTYNILNKNKVKNKKSFNIIEKNINNNCASTNHYNKNLNNDKKLALYHNKIIENAAKLSTLRNNQIKSQSNTINNISNFNNCNYIYLFNNGEKFVKINKQFKQ